MSAKKFLTAAACGIALASSAALAGDTVTAEGLVMTAKWDKTFPQESGVAHSKVAFTNRFGITIAADLYKPENASGHLKAVAVSGPFGAVKEQASGLYAQELAKRGFLTIAFDPSFTGESGGVPRRVASPDINTEDFQAAADYLINRDDVDPEAVGIIGICGFAAWRSTPSLWTPASRRPWSPRCTTCTASAPTAILTNRTAKRRATPSKSS